MGKDIKPSIYEYEDYRQFMGDTAEFFKKTKPSFSYTFLAKQAGLGSEGTLRHVLKRRRHLLPKQIPKCVKGLKLGKDEAEFFENLVLYEISEDSATKAKHFEKMLQNKKYQSLKELSQEQYEYMAHWYIPTIRELIVFPSFRPDPDWIAETLCPPITRGEAKRALEVLEKLRLIERGPDGKLKQADQHVTTEPRISSVAYRNFYKEMMSNAYRSMEKMHPDDREISAAMLAIPHSKIPEIRQAVFKFLGKFLAQYDAAGDEPLDRVYQLNIQLFPVAKD